MNSSFVLKMNLQFSALCETNTREVTYMYISMANGGFVLRYR